jgi:hypothetical protein
MWMPHAKLLGNVPCPLIPRRLDAVCTAGYTRRKRGEVVRTRTVALQMHTRQWIGTYAGRGNGDYQGELASALRAITNLLEVLCPHARGCTGRVSMDNMVTR